MILQAAKDLWPELQCDIQYNHDLDISKQEYGRTTFPDDGSQPLVEISPHLTVMESIEIIGHELAHVRAGKDAGHGKAWHECFDALHRHFMTVYKNAIKKFRGGELMQTDGKGD